MFTGLVTDVGRVARVEDTGGIRRFGVETGWNLDGLDIGASVMHSGVCLTVTAKADGLFFVEAVPETLSRTTLGDWQEGAAVNLERSLKLGDELGGHFVFGHVDGLGDIVSVTPEGESHRLRVRPPASLTRFIAEKGSIAVDGVSLTVAATHDNGDFDLAIIPHTWDVTTLREAAPGRRVNLEIDMLARYVARMVGHSAGEAGSHG